MAPRTRTGGQRRLDHGRKALDALGNRAVDVRWLKASLAEPNTTISSGLSSPPPRSPADWA
jgi:hypothetical protein